MSGGITIKDIEPLVPFSRGSSEIFLTGRWSSKKPAWKERTSPCRHACPVGNDIARAFSVASRGGIDEALAIFRENNPLPGVCGRVCYHPCESDCNRKDLDETVNIRGFERYLADHGRVEPTAVITRKEKIAVIGSGPAGLAAAYHLARSGYGVTVFEALPEPGGMLMYGIPEYRLPKAVLRQEIVDITRTGVDIRTGVRVGRDIMLEELGRTYQAVFVAVGAHKGAPIEGAIEGLEFLRRVNSGAEIILGMKVAIIGGGNTAIDCARSARRLGADVLVVYRRSRSEMPALREDVEAAEGEGVKIEFLATPMSITAGVMECLRMELGAPDAGGRASAVVIPGSEFRIQVDTVIAAIGQTPETAFLVESGVLLDHAGTIQVNPSTSTNIAGLFAGGDAAGARAFVADALGSGKRAALAIRSYLEGNNAEHEYEQRRIGSGPSFSFDPPADVDLKDVVTSDKLNTICIPYAHRNNAANDAAAKTAGDFEETVKTLGRDQAISEIARCFKCGTCTQCDLCFLICPDISVIRSPSGGYALKADYCKGCGVCAATCPRDAIEMGGGA